MNIDDYAKACGPSALAALLQRSPVPVAHELLGIQRARGHVIAPLTPSGHLAVFLHRRGRRVEPWLTYADDCRPQCTAEEFLDTLRRPPVTVDQAVAFLSASPGEAETLRRRSREIAARDQARRRLTVDEWRNRFDGDWLLYTVDHVLAVRDGHIASGDTPNAEEYGDCELLSAERIFTQGEHHGEENRNNLRPSRSGCNEWHSETMQSTDCRARKDCRGG